ncbi:hypothetical protein Mgra_00006781 [Meloidogyne graminicola]|uniref:Uncharacterized protein n=1 Tax=Meloidogyne graminicola TaxID=189291 RepID=A0A8S9ZKI8_9BILA|nr:hypothetical protein Mgra_00006781 [Meloidogyne graminicola]
MLMNKNSGQKAENLAPNEIMRMKDEEKEQQNGIMKTIVWWIIFICSCLAITSVFACKPPLYFSKN